jgi:hypothetical protein
MKKNLLLGAVFIGQLGMSYAQVPRVHRSSNALEISTESPKETTSQNTEKALGFEFYYDNFDNVVGGVGLTSPLGASSWTINNSGQTGPTFGWTIDNVRDGWWAPATAIASTSEGKFAELTNGNPTLQPAGTQAIGVTYTMTSGPIDVMTLAATDEVSMSFQQYGAKFNDNQQIFVSTNGTTWQLVGSNVNKPTLSAANTGNAYPNPELKIINLVNFIAGNAGSVYIRFSWTSEFPAETTPNAWVAYGWYIDDLKLFTNPDNEVAIAATFIGDFITDWSYSQVPVDQVTPMVVGFALENRGIDDMTAAPVNVSIRLNGTEVLNFNEPITLLSGMSDTFFITSAYTPSTLGDYTVLVTLPADDLLTNNSSISAVMKTTEYIFGHDYGGTASQGFDEDGAYAIGNLYQMYADQEVAAVNVRFRSGTTVGQEVEVAIYGVTAGIQGTLDFVTVTYHTVVAADLTAPFTVIRLDAPALLSQDNLYMVYVKKSDGSDRLNVASSPVGDNDFSTVVYGPFAAANAVNYFNDWSWSPFVRLNFDPSLSIENVSLLDGVKVYPNPSNGLITISNDNGTENTITILDMTGKVVVTRVVNTSLEMDLNSFGSGVYMVEVSNENGKKAERVVIK